MVLVADVSGESGAVAAAVQSQADRRQLTILALYARLAVAAGDVEAAAPIAVGAEAAGEVGGQIEFALAVDARGQPVQGCVGRALGRQVEGAADAAAAGGGAVQEGRGPVEDLDPLKEFRRHELARQDAVEAVVRHVVRVNREAADDIQLLEIPEALGHAHGRVVLQHVADTAGLLVAGQFLRVAGRGERGVHRVHRAEQADPTPARDLIAGVGGGQGDL